MTTHYFMLYFFPSCVARDLESINNETLLGLLSPLLSYYCILLQGHCSLRLWMEYRMISNLKYMRVLRLSINSPGPQIRRTIYEIIVLFLNQEESLESLFVWPVQMIKIKRYVGYNLGILRQYTCPIIGPSTVCGFGFLCNCTTVAQASY